MHPKRYKAFYYCKTVAFVSSVVIIVIVQSKELSSPATIRRAVLKTAMILDLFGLMGAYVAGSFRDAPTTIYVFSLAVAVFAYSIVKVVAYTHGQSMVTEWMRGMSDRLAKLFRLSDGQPEPEGSEEERKKLERRRKFLIQLAILAATVTYQIGLSPPGRFWPESKRKGSHVAGDPVLLNHYGIRYQVFFYFNATGFMASVTVILMLVNQKLYKQGIRSNARRKMMMNRPPKKWRPCAPAQVALPSTRAWLASLERAVLAPPGGTGDDSASSPSPSPSAASPPNVAGNPILLHSNLVRYQAFFSFMASIIIIMLLLQYTVKKKRRGTPLWALGAYATGSCRDLETSAYVIALVGAVVVFITIYALLSFDAVKGRAKELTVWKCFSRMMEKCVWRHSGVSNGDGDRSAPATGASV
ncbi:hypothetical protein ZWY2020_041663 [Hordeum vulgare]|nr:hypothetical protein ZWY2020_041663 [Hordeum vulgare]